MLLSLLALSLLLSGLSEKSLPGQIPTSPKTQIIMLGTGTPNADPDRSGPSVAIVVNDTPYIIDFGPGVVRRAEAARRKGITGLAMPKLSKAFVTHLHSDHTLGFADLIFSPWVLERKDPLEVFGPKGLSIGSHGWCTAWHPSQILVVDRTGWTDLLCHSSAFTIARAHCDSDFFCNAAARIHDGTHRSMVAHSSSIVCLLDAPRQFTIFPFAKHS